MTDWKWAARNLLRNLRRTIVTASALAFGFTGLGLIGGYIERVEKLVYTQTIYTKQNGHITISVKGGLDGFTHSPGKYLLSQKQVDEIEAFLKSQNGVELVGKTISGVGLVSAGDFSVPFVAEGFDEQERQFTCRHPMVLQWNPEAMTPDCQQDYSPDELTMTKNLASSIRLETDQANPNTPVSLLSRSFQGDLNGVSAKLRAFHSTGMAITEDSSLRAPNKLLQELYGAEGVWLVRVYVTDDSHIAPVVSALKEKFPTLDILSYRENGFGDYYAGVMSFLYVIGAFFFLLIMGAVLLSLVNSLTISTMERSVEIGTLRSMGFSVERISGLFAKEAFVMGLISSLLGTVLAVAVSITINSLNIRFFPVGAATDIQFVLSPTVWILFGIAAPLIGISYVTALVVTKKLLKQSIIGLLSDSGGRQ